MKDFIELGEDNVRAVAEETGWSVAELRELIESPTRWKVHVSGITLIDEENP